METDDGETGILLGLKYAEDGNLEAACEKALRQMEQKKYEEVLLDEGVIHILKYGISFYKKRCCVKLVGAKKIKEHLRWYLEKTSLWHFSCLEKCYNEVYHYFKNIRSNFSWTAR